MKKNTPTWLIVLIVVLVTLFYMLIVWSFFVIDSNSKWKLNNNGSISIEDGELTIKNDTKGYYDQKNKTYFIIGTLTNNSSNNYNYIELEYNVYDKNKNILGNAYTSINGIKKGKSWKFKVKYTEIDAEDIKKFEINRIEAY